MNFYKDFTMFNLELPWRVADGAVSAATYRILLEFVVLWVRRRGSDLPHCSVPE